MEVSILQNAFRTIRDYGYQVIFLIAREVELADLITQVRPIVGALSHTIVPHEDQPVTGLVLLGVSTVVDNNIPEGHFRLASIPNGLYLGMHHLFMLNDMPQTHVPIGPGHPWVREFESDPDFIFDNGIRIPRRLPGLPGFHLSFTGSTSIPDPVPPLPTRFERLVATDDS